MPFDGVHTRIDKLQRARAILGTQSDEDQGSYETCLWAGLVKAGMVSDHQISGEFDRRSRVMGALGVGAFPAAYLMGGSSVAHKVAVINLLIGGAPFLMGEAA